jgi:hypothetical protein
MEEDKTQKDFLLEIEPWDHWIPRLFRCIGREVTHFEG